MEATLSYIPDDGGYEAAEVLEADQPSVVRAIAICLRPNEEYRVIHQRYVHTLAGAGFTVVKMVDFSRRTSVSLL